MRIHKEGRVILLIAALVVIAINSTLLYFLKDHPVSVAIFFVTILFFVFLMGFFRKPYRRSVKSANQVVSPADGKVVAIEIVDENEYFNDKRLVVSVFMSVWDVHINWYPIGGIVKYFKYHPGKFLVAFNPKSSELNERTSIVVGNENHEVLFRQIAGALARRIVSYAKKGNTVKQASEVGFIKFGSRVDVFMPVDTKLYIKIGDKVVGSQTVIADL